MGMEQRGAAAECGVPAAPAALFLLQTPLLLVVPARDFYNVRLPLGDLSSFLKNALEPWPAWLGWLEHHSVTKGPWVWFLVRAHA